MYNKEKKTANFSDFFELTQNYVKEYEKVNNVEVILEEYEKTNNVKAIVEPQIEDEVKYPWEEDDDECLPFC